MVKVFFVLILEVFACLAHAESFKTPHLLWDETDPLVLELVYHPAFQRLKHIEQHGLWTKLDKHETPYSRYEHSLGVYSLLKKHKASRREQIAGLLHDVSHTAFSHVGDRVFGSSDPNEEAYQDAVHTQYLKNSGLAEVLMRHGIQPEKVDPKGGEFEMLEQGHPDLCADRLDYILQGGLKAGLIPWSQLSHIEESLQYDASLNRWSFQDRESAFLFSQSALLLSEHTWGNGLNTISEHWFSEMVREAVDLKIMSSDDFKFGCDDDVWSKLMNHSHPAMVRWQNVLKNPQMFFHITSDKECAGLSFKRKFRGVDPWVGTGHELVRLTEVSRVYRDEYNLKKAHHTEGFCFSVVPF